MKDEIFNVKIGKCEFEVHGACIKGDAGDHIQPRTQDQVDINKVFYKGIEISDLLDEVNGMFYDELTDKILQLN